MNDRFWPAVLLAVALLPPVSIAAQESSEMLVRVSDAAGDPIRSATVRLLVGERDEVGPARLTNGSGVIWFRGLAPGEYRVVAEHLGYEGRHAAITLAAAETARVTLSLPERAIQLDGIAVRVESAGARERQRFLDETGLSARTVGGDDLKAVPAVGEADVLRVVQTMPGVASASDFAAAYNVRGGAADQNLILLDGFPLFNPFHLGGLFSVFNSDVVARAELFTGGFSAEYGGRVSSVLDVETRSTLDGDEQVHLGLSLLSSRLAWQSPLPAGLATIFGGDTADVLLSGRRSYLDWVLRPVVSFPYHLSDLQGRVEWETAGDGELSLVVYHGRDRLDVRDPEAFGLGEDAESFMRFRWAWGNSLVGIRWSRPFGAYEAELRAGSSGFFSVFDLPDFDDSEISSRIRQATLKADFTGPLGASVELKTGLQADRISYQNVTRSVGTEFSRQEDDGIATASYAQLRWQPSARWRVEAGVRAEGWWGEAYHGAISPRLAARRYFGPAGDPRLAVRASAGRYVQFLHSLRDEALPFSNDTWVLADEAVPPIISDQLQVGADWYPAPGWAISGDVFTRTFDGITDLNLAADPNDTADDLLVGTGKASGADAFIRRTTGTFRGWAALSFLEVEHTFPDPLRPAGETRPMTTFAPVFDRRVSLDLVAIARLGERTELSARWGFGTGVPYTRPVAQSTAWRFDAATGRYALDTDSEGDPRRFVVLGERSGERYPAYHRLDVGIRRTWNPGWGEVTAFGQLINVYNRKDNVLYYSFDYSGEPPTRSGLSMLPLLPTLGLEVAW